MPVGDFSGRRDWGYDGVFPYAPDASYGRPERLQGVRRRGARARPRGLLDVVYNHFGPDGNVLPARRARTSSRAATRRPGATRSISTGRTRVRCATSSSRTPNTGSRNSISTGCGSTPSTRSTTTAGPTSSTRLAARVRARFDGPVHLILENEDNEPDAARARRHGRVLRYDAQWNDDVHHVLRVAATGEQTGYYRRLRRDAALARALAEGFAYQGEVIPPPRRAARGAERGAAAGQPSSPSSRITTRSAIARSASGSTRSRRRQVVRALASVVLPRAADPDAVHGRGMGRARAVPVLLRFLRRPRRGGARRGRRE